MRGQLTIRRLITGPSRGSDRHVRDAIERPLEASASRFARPHHLRREWQSLRLQTVAKQMRRHAIRTNAEKVTIEWMGRADDLAIAGAASSAQGMGS